MNISEAGSLGVLFFILKEALYFHNLLFFKLLNLTEKYRCFFVFSGCVLHDICGKLQLSWEMHLFSTILYYEEALYFCSNLFYS